MKETEKETENAGRAAARPEQAPSAIIVGISLGREEEDFCQSLTETAALAETAGFTVSLTLRQNRVQPDRRTYLGSGKARELAEAAEAVAAEIIIFEDELSPLMLRNLAAVSDCKIIDRTMLILDIFAARAASREGKLQVELAQLRYLLPRLSGQGTALSRLGGGIGTRGPGETKLEMDRRKIRRRIADLEGQLQEIATRRSLQRRQRQAEGLCQIALVGYTNAGKSTLLNRLCQSGELAADQLFATLDTHIRRLTLADGRVLLLSDTVGFIRRLPHHLVAAFRATLEESQAADLLLHVLDAAAPDVEAQAEAVMAVLRQLGVEEKPILTALNKVDCLAEPAALERLLLRFQPAAAISAQTGQGLDELLTLLKTHLPEPILEKELLLPFSAGAALAALHQQAVSCQRRDEEAGIRLFVRISAKEWGRFGKQYPGYQQWLAAEEGLKDGE